QFNIPKQLFGDSARFLKEGMQVLVAMESEEPIMAQAPTTVELEITYTEPAVKGDTSTNALKNATVETGVEIKVPLFINQGDKVKVDTRSGAYVERVKLFRALRQMGPSTKQALRKIYREKRI